MTTYPVRFGYQQQVHFIHATVNYNSANLGSGYAIGSIPANSIITGCVVQVPTGFNSQTVTGLTIGFTTNGTDIATTGNTGVGSTGAKNVTTAGGVLTTSDTDVFVRYTAGGTAATAGQAIVAVSYVPPNDLT